MKPGVQFNFGTAGAGGASVMALTYGHLIFGTVTVPVTVPVTTMAVTVSGYLSKSCRGDS